MGASRANPGPNAAVLQFQIAGPARREPVPDILAPFAATARARITASQRTQILKFSG